MENRIRNQALKAKVTSAEEASLLIKNGMNIATSGFTLVGYPKAVSMALAKRTQESGENLKINLYTGASVGDELDGILAQQDMICHRFPYQTNGRMRDAINQGQVNYADIHLGHFPLYLSHGFYGKVDIAIVEAVAITEEGHIIPPNSVGIAPTAVAMADKVIVEINQELPLSFEGLADIYYVDQPPRTKPIPIQKVGNRIGTTYIPCGPEKIAAIVFSNMSDPERPLMPLDNVSTQMANHLLDFLRFEIKHDRLPKNLLPIQSGIGSVSNAVLAGFADSEFTDIEIFSEVIQDSILDLIDCGKVKSASCTSVSPFGKGLKKFKEQIEFYKKSIVLRPQEISNHSELVRRLGVLAFNTAIEADIYGNVNSTHIVGSRIMNGIGGSGDFARNAYLSVFTTASTAKDGNISSIVPMVSHVDHTEHDVMVIVTEQGFADLRGLCPRERAALIIERCAHPDFKPMLRDYLRRAELGEYKQTPHLLNEALSWHQCLLDTGSMRNIKK